MLHHDGLKPEERWKQTFQTAQAATGEAKIPSFGRSAADEANRPLYTQGESWLDRHPGIKPR